MRDKLTKLWNVFKKYGFIGFCRKTYLYVKANYLEKFWFKVNFKKKKYVDELNEILNNEQYERVIVWRDRFGYDVPLFQRAQHIANNLAKQGCLVFYEVTTMTDKVKTYKKQTDNLYLLNFNNLALKELLMKALDECNKPKYLQFYSTDWNMTLDEVKKFVDRGYKVIYEYIDDLSPEIVGTKELPKNIIDKYEYAMKNNDVYVVVTASLLEEDVIKKRGKKNLTFSSNGVDYAFFKQYDNEFVIDNDFKKILDNGKPIICYYGALAKWFDYELLKKLAKMDKYSIVLFGVKYDDVYDKELTGKEKNIYFMGSRDYKVLKYYACMCDVLIIPFKVNKITESTSPVKIFEYMALNKPIVVTDLKECRKYKSVLVSKNHDEFMRNIKIALNKKEDQNYLRILDREAKDNDWSSKASSIIKLIEKDER